ncbi:undecaprenyl-diphosphate phosphatase [Butyricicoccus faecihominis]|uniref:undecaprenyl-diphosphate phosphatase n=1 Tax=Butyricicoccaceae TaxID=3085642 RepID=UPI0024798E82|nr:MULTISPECIES: undecaprenyl-diphosphate phosphatase [Butyricicoccaceae]MCQ5131089.1 undecaprenyl-diphosphate phosphatase [Butyricicoccus faecihominis]WNX84140.1 undecaprenyl-diphosphate phosphatase [Agathobaculum sp. NTUH-O15-33]
MSLWFAILLGLVQGLTEFLPVSSSGHLVLAQTLFGGDVEADYMLFNVLLHFGTLLSVVVAFWKDIKELFVEFFGWVKDGFKINGHPYRRFVIMVLLTIVPMFAVLPIKSKLEAAFSSPLVVGLLLLVTAGILLLSEKAPHKNKTEENATWLDALLVGVAQCFAVLPGLSRSGTTICAGLFRGFSRDFAVRFAFIMSLPVVLGANILELADAIKAPAAAGAVPLYIYIVGILVAMIAGLAAIKMVRMVSKSGHFRPFAVYCALIGVITIVVTLVKTL